MLLQLAENVPQNCSQNAISWLEHKWLAGIGQCPVIADYLAITKRNLKLNFLIAITITLALEDGMVKKFACSP